LMRIHVVAYLLMAFLCVQYAKAQVDENPPELHFVNNRDHCLFTMTLKTILPADTVPAILFEYENLLEISQEVSHIRMLSSDSNSYIVEFTIHYLFNEMISTYERKINSQREISIEMLSFRQTIRVLPRVTATSARFTCTRDTSGNTSIHYEQSLSLNHPLTWVHYAVVKHKLKGFSEDVVTFIRKCEKEYLLTNTLPPSNKMNSGG